jgi:hypothetical protein
LASGLRERLEAHLEASARQPLPDTFGEASARMALGDTHVMYRTLLQETGELTKKQRKKGEEYKFHDGRGACCRYITSVDRQRQQAWMMHPARSRGRPHNAAGDSRGSQCLSLR